MSTLFGAIIYLRRKGYLRLTRLKISTLSQWYKIRVYAPKPRFWRGCIYDPLLFADHTTQDTKSANKFYLD